MNIISLRLYAPVLLLLLRVPAAAQQPDSLPVWPPPPERPRIRFLETIATPSAFHRQQGFFAKLLGLIAGGEQRPHWLVQPVGIAVSPKGVIAVADPGAHGVHVLVPSDGEYKFVGETGSGPFRSPVDVAYAADGTLYVSDSERGDITAFDEGLGEQFRVSDSLERPTGLAVAGESLFVADAARHRIVAFSRQGRVLASFGGRGSDPGQFNYPVAVAGGDSLLVLDALNFRVQKFSRGGAFAGMFGGRGDVAGRFAAAKGIARDADGDIYVTDALMDNFQIFDPAGRLLLVVGRQGQGHGEFMSPGGIAIDARDRIYVVETLNPRIQIFQYLR